MNPRGRVWWGVARAGGAGLPHLTGRTYSRAVNPRLATLLLTVLCACGGGSSWVVRGPGPYGGRLAQSTDSASAACQKNPVYCTAVPGEETVVPPVQMAPPAPPPRTPGRGKDRSKPGTSEQSKEDTVELTPAELKKRCDEEFTHCLGTPVQSIRGPKFDHSQCVACRDLCMQNAGVWPAQANDKPCP